MQRRDALGVEAQHQELLADPCSASTSLLELEELNQRLDDLDLRFVERAAHLHGKLKEEP